MAETSISVSVDEFTCSVCLQLFKDPVTVPCGHSYCMGCISGYWTQFDPIGVYSCPQCRTTFTPKPVLNKNTILAEMVKKLKTKDQTAVPAHCYAAPGDVEWDVSTELKHTDIILKPEPETREHFLQYAHQLTLDRNTLHKRLCLSEENRAISITGRIWQCNDHPERFDPLFQALSRERVCGRSYWEVEWSGVGIGISVSYRSISRKGRGHESEFGRNDQSWSLYCSDSRCTFWHNNIETKLPVMSKSCRIGVYVDDTAGTLSFYSIRDSNTVTLIHSIQTTFTQPLYSGFRLYLNCKVVLCDLTT